MNQNQTLLSSHMSQVQSLKSFVTVQPIQEHTKDSDTYSGDRNRKTVEPPEEQHPVFLDEKREYRREEEGQIATPNHAPKGCTVRD